jgi:hypothetical protein
MVMHERTGASATDSPKPQLHVFASDYSPTKTITIRFFEFFLFKEIAILILQIHIFIPFRS